VSHPLVPSDRVEAAVVYGRDGQKLGTIERLMLEKKRQRSWGTKVARRSQELHYPPRAPRFRLHLSALRRREAYRTSWECHGNSELELLAAQALRAGGFLVDSASNFCPRFGVPGRVSVGRFCADASLPNARFGV
jgi:hypothetical protein